MKMQSSKAGRRRRKVAEEKTNGRGERRGNVGCDGNDRKGSNIEI